MKLGPAQLGAFFTTTVLASVGAAAAYVHVFAPAPVVSVTVPPGEPTPSRDPQPTLEIETSPEVRYEVLAEVLATAKNANMIKIGFVE